MFSSVFIGLFIIAAVSAQPLSRDWLNSICRYGVDYDDSRSFETCGTNKRCSSDSHCQYVLGGTFGICCNNAPTTTTDLQCPSGEPLPGVTCGGFIGQPCPDPNRYDCVTDPFVADAQGVCCPRQVAQCSVGQPLPGATCGGPIGKPCPDPRYECVGPPLVIDGPGICCLRTDTANLQCPSGEPLPGVTCGGFAGQPCPNPSTHQCVTNPLVPDSLGVCCPIVAQCSIGKPLPGISCGGLLGRQCPDPRYECVGPQLAFDGPGICCLRDDTANLQCPSGQPLPGVSCGGFVGQPCPNPNTHQCVTNPLVPDSLGVCCPLVAQCSVGQPLPGVTCGGRPPRPCPNPRYECVGPQLVFDGPGVCCLRDDPIPPTRCPVGRPLPGVTCGGIFPQPCPHPRRYQCITTPGVPDSPGICCPRRGPRY